MGFTGRLIWFWLTLLAVACSQPDPPSAPSGTRSTQPAENTNDSDEASADATAQETDTQPQKEEEAGTALTDEEACAESGFYYDLAAKACTDRQLASFNCDLTELVGEDSDILANNQKQQIGNFFENELSDYQLRYCVDDGDSYTLVAIKDLGDNKIRIQTLEVPKN